MLHILFRFFAFFILTLKSCQNCWYKYWFNFAQIKFCFCLLEINTVEDLAKFIKNDDASVVGKS